MSLYDTNHSTDHRRAPRLWIVETLVVVGVLAFGYFAITVDSSMFTGQPATDSRPVSPLDDLLR